MEEADTDGVRQRKKPSSSTPPPSQYYEESRKPHPRPLEPRTKTVFSFLFASHLVAAIYHPIQDCDEVFNYWEPTHFLTHGHGFQTWEYSPVFAIRSWAYTGLHALMTLNGKAIPFRHGDKVIEFYLLRIALGFVCAKCETRLFNKIAATINPRVAIAFLFVMATSPGMFHASVAYLPSSFTMYTTMLGMAAFIDWKGGLRTSEGVFAIGAGAVLGWPFAAAMAVPFMVEEAVLAAISDRASVDKLVSRVAEGAGATLAVLATQVGIDTFFYKKQTIVPLNIVRYNIFSGKGPDLYGTEPWHFYLRNLFLNFHVWLILALLSMPLLITQHYVRGLKGRMKASHWRGVVFLSPFYIWLGIFTVQPHKEERFMYPAYPALALNASMALFIILSYFNSADRKSIIGKVPLQLRNSVTIVFVLFALAVSILRVIGTVTAYNAPLSIYKPLHHPAIASINDTVCLGKEWYRFPSHFLLPHDMRAKFIKSEFSGLLPGEFIEGGALSSRTSFEPSGMNDENREDPQTYTKLKQCNFLVDLQLPSTESTDLEPNYMADTEHWERIKCLPFMDAATTGVLGRLLWTPDLSFVPEKYRRTHGDYCLLKRRKLPGTLKRDPVPHIETLG